MGDPHAGGVQRLAEKLSAGAQPAVTWLDVRHRHVGDAGDSALAAALGRGALPRLKYLELSNTGIGDAGLVALAPALLALPALGPRWGGSISTVTRSATRASPPSWRRRRRQVRRRRRQEGG